MDKAKISFGFSKVSKKPTLLQTSQKSKEISKVELIKCLEGKEIKLVEEKKEQVALVIPLKSNQRTSTALASLMRRRAVLLGEEDPENVQNKSTENTNETNGDCDTLEKRAARELLSELKSKREETDNSTMVVPVVKPDDLPLDGAKEPSIDDYDSIPVQQFGMAMLRGMGWVEPPKKSTNSLPEEPVLRPKGMGLGADKALKAKPLLIPPENNEILEIKKKAYVRILGGKFKDLYGQIEGFDDHAGRVIVKMAVGGTKEAFNEFLCQPISKKEFTEYGRCINTNEYKKLKELENENGQIIMKRELRLEPKKEKEEKEERDNKDIKREADQKIKMDKYKEERDSKELKRELDYKMQVEKYKEEPYERDDKMKVDKYRDERRANQRDMDWGRDRKSRSRSRARYPENNRHAEYKASCSELRQNIRKKFELTDDSSQSRSERECEQRKHKKSKAKSKSSKKKKERRRNVHSSSDDSAGHEERTKKSGTSHKKTKKSKKGRSRSCSRGKR